MAATATQTFELVQESEAHVRSQDCLEQWTTSREVGRLRSHDAPRAYVGLQAFLAQHVPRIRPNEFGMIVDIVRNDFVRVPMR